MLKGISSRGLGVQRWLVLHVPVWIPACASSRLFLRRLWFSSTVVPISVFTGAVYWCAKWILSFFPSFFLRVSPFR